MMEINKIIAVTLPYRKEAPVPGADCLLLNRKARILSLGGEVDSSIIYQWGRF